MSGDELTYELDQLLSERRNTRTMKLDSMGSLELVKALNEEDKTVAYAVERELPRIAEAVDLVCHALDNSGRLFYVGAGTSGRLGVLDAVECPPTFGVSGSRVVGVIAGGGEAMFQSQEGAEDSESNGKADLVAHELNERDVVVGIAASGRTPYVIGALNYAASLGTPTIALSCNPGSSIAALADIAISPVVGPEALTGSTRLKSGTAQKLVLNMLSTASMVRTGKCYQNLMVDVKASNDKLRARALRIVMQATGCDRAAAASRLEESHYEVKTAILMQLTGLSFEDASARLENSRGHLRRATEA